MDNSNLAAQVLRSQAMMGMRETMKKVAREVFEEEVRPKMTDRLVRPNIVRPDLVDNPSFGGVS